MMTKITLIGPSYLCVVEVGHVLVSTGSCTTQTDSTDDDRYTRKRQRTSLLQTVTPPLVQK